jgi:glycosyltransferase involved in cell wall biosynthesis
MDRDLSVVHLNKHESTGGAAIAASRLHGSLRDHGVDSTMLVERTSSSDPTVQSRTRLPNGVTSVLRFGLDTLRTYAAAGSVAGFSSAQIPSRVSREIGDRDPDVTHLHWVGDGYLSAEDIGEIPGPLVWTLHDNWAFTGGCHYAEDCTRYRDACGACPVLGSDDEDDLSARTLARKREHWDHSSFHLVAPSNWIIEMCRESTLFGEADSRVIPNGIDTEAFRPEVDTGLNVPTGEKTTILFGALSATSDHRKGHDLLAKALNGLDRPSEYRCLVFGGDGDVLPESDVTVHSLGYLPESHLVDLYGSCDVMVVPSRYESFGQTAVEALACGTPVVAFDATGPRDIVTHRKTGYLAEPYVPLDLQAGIEWVTASETRNERLGSAARTDAVERFDIGTVTEQYATLYESIA